MEQGKGGSVKKHVFIDTHEDTLESGSGHAKDIEERVLHPNSLRSQLTEGRREGAEEAIVEKGLNCPCYFRDS